MARSDSPRTRASCACCQSRQPGEAFSRGEGWPTNRRNSPKEGRHDVMRQPRGEGWGEAGWALSYRPAAKGGLKENGGKAGPGESFPATVPETSQAVAAHGG